MTKLSTLVFNTSHISTSVLSKTRERRLLETLLTVNGPLHWREENQTTPQINTSGQLEGSLSHCLRNMAVYQFVWQAAITTLIIYTQKISQYHLHSITALLLLLLQRLGLWAERLSDCQKGLVIPLSPMSQINFFSNICQ